MTESMLTENENVPESALLAFQNFRPDNRPIFPRKSGFIAELKNCFYLRDTRS